jgi:beta-glucosidase
VRVSVDITNSGTRSGDEVVQLYVQHAGRAVPRALRDLRGYARVRLAPGETRSVTLPLAISSLAYWNEGTRAWMMERETVRIQVGASSADIRRQTDIEVVP